MPDIDPFHGLAQTTPAYWIFSYGRHVIMIEKIGLHRVYVDGKLVSGGLPHPTPPFDNLFEALAGAASCFRASEGVRGLEEVQAHATRLITMAVSQMEATAKQVAEVAVKQGAG